MTIVELPKSMWTNIRWCLLIVCLCSPMLTHGAESQQTRRRLNSVHGPREFLQRTLVQSARETRLLDAAASHLKTGDRRLAWQALLQVFSQPHESFTTVAPGKLSSGTYQQAFALLQDADTQARLDWINTAEPLAAAAMMAVGQDPDALADVARRFPFTPSGIRALRARIVLAYSRGQTEFARTLLGNLREMSATDIIRLEDRVSSEAQDVRSPTMAGGSTNRLSNLNLPWPEALWSWQESVWRTPIHSIFAGLSLPENRMLFSVNSWKPALAGNSVFVRTPLRIMAFEKNSGRVLWSITTDTVPHAANGLDAPKNLAMSRRASITETLQLNSMGTLSVSDEYLFFVDHFRTFNESMEYDRFGNPTLRQLFQNRAANEQIRKAGVNGSRLVAIRRSERDPSVAWTVGDAGRFNYRFSGEKYVQPEKSFGHPDNQDNSSQVSKTLDSEGVTFAGEQFLGPPVSFDGLVFVLSAGREMVWLNCLSESSGRVSWKTPLAFDNENEGVQIRTRQTLSLLATGASLCGVDGENIVSVLSNGLVVGASIANGNLRWATNIGDATPDRPSGLAGLLTSASKKLIRPQPLLNNGRLVCIAPGSGSVHCLNTKNGTIIWKTSRIATGPPRVEGSIDQYPVFASNDQVVLVGTRHVRALDSKTGEQRWIVSVLPQTGHACCSHSACLVPQIDGSIVRINIHDGTCDHVTHSTVGDSAYGITGSIVADDDVVCVSTPLSVELLPSPLAVEKEIADDDWLLPTSNQYARAKSLLLADKTVQGIQALTRIVSDRNSKLPLKADSRNLLIETLLTQVSQTNGTGNSSAVDELQISEQLKQMHLSPQQLIRHAILSGQHDIDLAHAELPVPLPMLKLSPEWQARADVASWSALPPNIAIQVATFDHANSTQPSNIEHAILFPDNVGELEEQLRFADRLRDEQKFAAAEMFLLATFFRAEGTTKDRLRDEISGLRTTALDKSKVRSSATNAQVVNGIEQTLRLASESELIAIRDSIRVRSQPVVPNWYKERLFLTNKAIFSVDMDLGVSTHVCSLPATSDAVGEADAFETPGIVPIVSGDHVGVVTLLSPHGPELLWWKRIDRHESENFRIEVGPFGADFLMVTNGFRVMCLHPLTGRKLWSRRASFDVQNSIRQSVVGDHLAIARISQNRKSCEVYRTRDGKRLRDIELDLPRNATPLVSGRKLLYVKTKRSHSRPGAGSQSNSATPEVVLMDVLTGQNVLGDREPLQLLGSGRGQLLSDHRAITITHDLDLVVLDLKTGMRQMTCSVADIVTPEEIIGLYAFERFGKLFVLLKDFKGSRFRRTASSRMGSVRLDSGVLCCVEPKSGQIMWYRKNPAPCVVQEVFGDATGLMLTWSWQNPEYIWERQIRRFPQSEASPDEERSLVVRLIDTDTGELLTEEGKLSPAEPLRCTFDASNQMLTLESDTSIINVKCAPASSEEN